MLQVNETVTTCVRPLERDCSEAGKQTESEVQEEGQRAGRLVRTTLSSQLSSISDLLADTLAPQPGPVPSANQRAGAARRLDLEALSNDESECRGYHETVCAGGGAAGDPDRLGDSCQQGRNYFWCQYKHSTNRLLIFFLLMLSRPT